MIQTMFLSREEFAAKRRKAQDDAVDVLASAVKNSLGGKVDETLAEKMFAVFADAYHQESGDEWTKDLPASITKAVNSMLSHSTESSDVQATALAIASMLINQASIQAASDDEDVFLEWVTMHDSDVRAAHKDTDGQVRPVGEKFDVAGVEMTMPGDVAAPIELWINCRCTLRPTFLDQQQANAEMFRQLSEQIPDDWSAWEDGFRDVSTDERKRRAKDGSAMPDGSYPIANCDDLKNAIQAIGRAKDPAKVKAHIKKRKSALGCPDVQIPDDWSDLSHTGFVYVAATPWWSTTTTNTGYILNGLPPYSTGGSMTTTETEPQSTEALDRLAAMDPEQQQAFESLVPWHGVLAPEGVPTGDGRMFAPGALSYRDLPLPLTYQKATSGGHDGSVTVGSIENITVKDGIAYADGYMLSTPEADEVIGLMAHFGKYGVSVDTDNVEFDYDEEADSVTFTSARISSASVVSIPAFAEAYVALGPWEDDSMVASATEWVKTEDGPGWLTHPVDTERLRKYWVHGPGAAKINWGVPGDFNRCRLELAKYVKPQYLSGYCANRHYDALGYWPGRPTAADTEPFEIEGTTAAPLNLVASGERVTAPAEWFADPEFTEVTHMTVEENGHVYGHVAQWGVCHIGLSGVCTTAPKSNTGYAYYANKRVPLDDGTYARTGVITLGGKHAPGRLRAASATQHYDDTTKALADVSVGEDEFGIWVNGMLRPGVEPEDVYALSASDVSGDWREVGGNLEMVAVLAVNAGGFPVKATVESGEMVTLIAAGMVQPQSTEGKATVGVDTDKFAEAIAKAFEVVERNKKERAAAMAALRGEFKED